MARAVSDGAVSRDRTEARHGVRLSIVAWEWALYAMIIIGTVFLRFWDLGARALHHDESLHATFSWYFSSGRGYQHDPLMHGPFQFHANALVFRLFGDGDYTSRVAAAVFGIILVLLPILLRKQLGRIGALTASFFFAISPTILYFSRFTREDIYFAVFTLALFICTFRYLESRRSGWLYGASAMLALSFATKEVAYMTAGLLLIYLDVLVGLEFWQRWRSIRPRRRIQSLLALVGFVAGAWVFVIAWSLSLGLRRKLGAESLSAASELLLVMATLTAPQGAPALQLPFSALGIPFQQGQASLFGYNFRGAGSLALLSVLALIGLSGYIGTAWDPKRWLLCAAAFYVPYILLFTTFFTNSAGFGSGIWGSLDYWLSQHDVKRGNQPLYYYVMLIPVYEFLPLILAFGGGVFLALRGDRFQRFLVVWLATIFLTLSWAGEKMPWLALHIAIPLALIAAKVIDSLWKRFVFPGMSGRQRALALAFTLAFVALVALTFRSAYVASFQHGDTPVELLIYTQTAPDIPRLMRQIQQAGVESGKGTRLPVVVDSTDSFSWPWAWYLRHYSQASYPAIGSGYEPPPDAVLLLNYTNTSVLGPFQELYGQGIPYHHRWWFPETYRGATPQGFLVSLTKAKTWQQWATYFLERKPPAELGSVDGIAFFPVALAESAGGQEPQLAIRTIGPETVIGKSGIRLGEFIRPAGVASDVAGNIYVMDSTNSRLQKFDSAGRFVASAGLRGTQVGGFTEPWGVIISDQGDVFVADTWNHRIQRFDSALRPVRTWGQPTQNIGSPQPNDLYGPRSIALDSAGNLFVTDTGNSRIVKYSQDGEVLGTFGGAGTGNSQFQEPVGIAISGDDTIYVADAWNRRIQRFDREFRYLGEIRIEGWGNRDITAKPYLAVLPDQRVAFTDPTNGRIGIADPRTGGVSIIDRLPSGERLVLPIGIWADREFLFVTDGRENVVRRIELDAIIAR